MREPLLLAFEKSKGRNIQITPHGFVKSLRDRYVSGRVAGLIRVPEDTTRMHCWEETNPMGSVVISLRV